MKTKIVAAAAGLFIVSGSTAFAQFPPAATAAGANSASATSWVAGIRAGNNWQNGALVFGVETDAQVTTLNSRFNTTLTGTLGPPQFPAPPTATANGEVEWYGTARARLGWAPGPWLLYATAGLAYGTVDVNSALTGAGFTPGSQISESRIGWVAGGGIEFLARPNVIISASYQYVNLGNVGFAANMPIFGGAGFLNQSGTDHAHFQVATVGISWLFTPSDKGPHGAWEGQYIGGHAGGAWGNPTDANYSAASPLIVSDVRLKRDIALLGRLDDGLGLYSYRYLWSDTVYVGVMAQEVAAAMPDAVVTGEDGYLRVDYGKLGLRLRTLAEWDAMTYGIRLD
jgi:opacity protein-like surface antigen